MNEPIKFSILIPVYNTEKYLRQCVDSVLNQGYDNIEVILVDDGSTDLSGEMCDEYSDKDSRIRVIHKENQGLISARRAGIKNAEGDYLMFLDSDDYWQPNMLKRISKTINEFDCDLVMIKAKMVYKNREVIESGIFPDRSVFEKDSKIDIYKQFLSGNKMNNLVLKIAKKSIVDADNDYSRFYGISYGEDLLQSVHLVINAAKIVYLDEALYCYRRDSGMTSNVKSCFISDGTFVREELTKMLKSTGEDLRHEIELMMCDFLRNIPKKIFRNVYVDRSSLREAVKRCMGSNFYSEAKKISWNNLSLIEKLLIRFIEDDRNSVYLIGELLQKIKVKLNRCRQEEQMK